MKVHLKHQHLVQSHSQKQQHQLQNQLLQTHKPNQINHNQLKKVVESPDQFQSQGLKTGAKVSLLEPNQLDLLESRVNQLKSQICIMG